MEQARQVPGPVIPLHRPQAHLGGAIERQRRGDTAGAIALYQRHLAEQPLDVAGWVALAQALRRSGASDSALLNLQRALRLAPRDAVVWSNLGDVWMDLGHAEQAVRAHRRAVDLAPQRIDLCLHCVATLRAMQHFHEAEALIDTCLAAEPARADLRYERALLCLYTGRMRSAWPDYAARPQPGIDASIRQPGACWSGERIGARRVLVIAGADAGETLWAARYIALLARRGAELSLVVDAALHPLLSALPVRLLEHGDARLSIEAFDFHAALGHLPWLVDPHGSTIPEPTALVLPPPASDEFPEDDSACLRVGLAWDSIRTGADTPQAPGIDRFAPLSTLPGVRVRCLPSGLPEGDPLALAAVVQSLDLVVTTDNAVAHLAGTLGKPVLNLLAFTPYWIWGVRGDATPRYPTMRLLRQPRHGHWDAVFEELIALVRGWARVRQREARRIATNRAKEARGTWF